MQKLTEVYKIENDGHREYFEPFTSLHIIIRCPNARVQDIIDATRAHNCSYKIIARIPAQNQSTHRYYRTAGAELRIIGQSRHIFALPGDIYEQIKKDVDDLIAEVETTADGNFNSCEDRERAIDLVNRATCGSIHNSNMAPWTVGNIYEAVLSSYSL